MYRLLICPLLLFCFITFFPATTLADDRVTQTFTLQPGWNALFISVRPDDGNPDTDDDAAPANVFAGVAGLDRVWAWLEPDSSVQFIQDADEIGYNDPGWSGYMPASGGPQASVVTNLFKILGARPYLVKIDASVQSTAQTFSVIGVPVNRRIRWTPDNFTLSGFAVDSTLGAGQTPTFADFLDIPLGSSPFIYALNPNGSWGFLNKNSPIQSGRAYWVYNDGTFYGSGPLEIDLASFNGMNFLDTVAMRPFTITNRSEQPVTPAITMSSGFPLVYFEGDDPDTGEPQWPHLSTLSPTLNEGEGVSVKLGVDRSGISAPASGVLTLRGGKSELHLPVYAQPIPPPYGLYVGTVTIRAVSEANEADSTTTTPVVSELSYRLMLHYGADETVSLLKTVYLMAQKGNPDPNSGVTPLGDTVLVTDESRLADFATVQQAGGVGQGYRLSSPVFDFTEPHQNLNCDMGAITTAGACNISLIIAADSPTNPMRHKYHPSHDGVLSNGQVEPASLPPHEREVWDITRDLTFNFNLPTTDNLFVPLGRVTGTYTEIITGMHKQPIQLGGDFTVERVTDIDELNPPRIVVVP